MDRCDTNTLKIKENHAPLVAQWQRIHCIELPIQEMWILSLG